LPTKKTRSALLIELTEIILESSAKTPIVLIDGKAGCGKSTFAKELQNCVFREGESAPRVLHLDDLYPGWDGLAAGVEYLNRVILTPLLKTGSATWQEYHWAKQKRSTWREFTGNTPLIVEGCGAINSFTHDFALASVWLEADETTRKKRWQERDGHRFDGYWQSWAAQELDFHSLQKSRDLADYLVDTSVF